MLALRELDKKSMARLTNRLQLNLPCTSILEALLKGDSVIGVWALSIESSAAATKGKTVRSMPSAFAAA